MTERDSHQDVVEGLKEWEQGVLRDALTRRGETKEEFRAESSGIPVKRLYTPLDLKRLDYTEKLGFPGSYPFTRGIDPLMYRANLWTIFKVSAFGGAEETNRRIKFLIAQGGKPRISPTPHLPHQIGLDSDHPLARGEVGRAGVAVDSLQDLEDIFDGISLDQLSGIHCQANSQSTLGLAMYIVLLEKKEADPQSIPLRIQNDVLKEYVARGTYIFPVAPAVKLSIDVVEHCARHFRNWIPMQVCGIHMRSAGATAVQELAFTLANAIAYIEETLKRGIDIDYFAPLLELYLRTDRDFFEEIAKYRAARRMWAKLIRERFGAKRPESWALKICSSVSGHTYTAQQPINNLPRITMEALAAVLGGVQAVMGMSYDEALGLPTEESAVADLRAQQIIAEERGVINTVDPLGGSYFVEALTDQLEEQTWKLMAEIEAMGGAIKAIESGYYRREIDWNARRMQQAIDSGERVVVGLNKYVADRETPIQVHRMDPEVEARQIEKVRRLRRERDNEQVKRALAELREAAREGVNTVPATIGAVRAYATGGEICDVLREVFGEYEIPAT